MLSVIRATEIIHESSMFLIYGTETNEADYTRTNQKIAQSRAVSIDKIHDKTRGLEKNMVYVP